MMTAKRVKLWTRRMRTQSCLRLLLHHRQKHPVAMMHTANLMTAATRALPRSWIEGPPPNPSLKRRRNLPAAATKRTGTIKVNFTFSATYNFGIYLNAYICSTPMPNVNFLSYLGRPHLRYQASSGLAVSAMTMAIIGVTEIGDVVEVPSQ